MRLSKGLCGLALCFTLTACDPAEEGGPAYQLAQGCYSIGNPVTQETMIQNGAYQLAKTDALAEPAAFFVKPSGLGRFLLQDQNGGLLAVDQGQVRRQSKADAKAEWEINALDLYQDGERVAETQTLVARKAQLRLIVREGQLTLAPAHQKPLKSQEAALLFTRLPDTACRPYPEAALDAIAHDNFDAPRQDQDEVFGYVDYHTHLAFPKALGAAAMSGDVFHPFGIEEALRSCSDLHGAKGELDLLEGQTASKGSSGHATNGYPDFTYWPHRGTNTHVTAYYRWVERTYHSGLRLLITNATGNPTFCQLLGVIHPGKAEGDCKSDQDLAMQTRYVYELQDYIDAQEGGPGQGWFRVVTSAREARSVIEQNKLAVVIGSEYGTLFDCTEGASFCTEDYVERKVQELYDSGVRSVFPIHRFDNAFGGTMPQGGTNGAWMHLTSKLSTSHVDHLTDLLNPTKLLFKPIGGHYWELEPCPEGVQGTGGIRSMEAFINEDFSFLTKTVSQVPVVGGFAARLLGWVFIDKLKPLPRYEDFSASEARACNKRPLQDIGRHLIKELAKRGMILEIDHLSYPTLMATLDTLENLQYPGFVSSHGWIENSPEIRQRMFRLGGLMAAGSGRPSEVGRSILRYQEEIAAFHPDRTGVGLGTDIQGISLQATGERDLTIQYPFTSIDGRVTFTPPRTGNRSFDFDREGIAHYGLLPEWIEELRQWDEREGTRAVDSLMRSAESYLKMWEAAEAQASRL